MRRWRESCWCDSGMSCAGARSWTWLSLGIPSNSAYSAILWCLLSARALVPAWCMGGGKLLLTALPEELGAAIQLASVLWAKQYSTNNWNGSLLYSKIYLFWWCWKQGSCYIGWHHVKSLLNCSYLSPWSDTILSRKQLSQFFTGQSLNPFPTIYRL